VLGFLGLLLVQQGCGLDLQYLLLDSTPEQEAASVLVEPLRLSAASVRPLLDLLLLGVLEQHHGGLVQVGVRRALEGWGSPWVALLHRGRLFTILIIMYLT
jgi:hypothetical protein